MAYTKYLYFFSKFGISVGDTEMAYVEKLP